MTFGSDPGWSSRLALFSTERFVDGVFWVDPSGRILFVNASACRLLEYEPHELIGRTIPEIDDNFPADRWPAHWAELRARRSFSFESEHRTKHGRRLCTEVTVNLVEHEGREYNCAVMRDITDRKAAGERLQRQLAQLQVVNRLATTLARSRDLQDIYEAALDGFQSIGADRLAILMCDEHGWARFVRWRRLSDRYRAAVEGHLFWPLDDPAPQPVLIPDVASEPAVVRFRDVADAEGIRSLTAIPITIGGRLFGKCMLYGDAPGRLPDEDLHLAQTIARHVALALERARADAELWRTSYLLRAIADGTDDAVWVKSLDRGYLWGNRAALAFMGRSAEELSRLGVDDLLPADEAVAIRAHDAEVLAGGEARIFDEQITTADGRRRIFSVRRGPLRDADGQIVGLFAIGRDMTAEREAEALLRRSESRFRALVLDSSDITSIIGADGRIAYESPLFYRLFGWTEAETIGRNAFDLVHPDDLPRVRAAFAEAVARQGHTASVQFRYRKADGTYLTLEAIGNNCLADPDVNGIVVNSRDVTERERLGEQLRHAQKMEAIGRLAGGVAHDFNNLLTVIGGNSAALLERHDLDEATDRDLREIRAAGERAAQLTRQLLAFGRRQPFDTQVVDVCGAVLGTTGMLRRLIGENIRLEVDVSAGSAPVRIDRGDLDQVLMNLAINARDAMPQGGTLRIGTRVDRENRQVTLLVRDTGTGMDEAVRSRMFEPFFTTKAPGEGTGLGLSTVYAIVTRGDGTIAVESPPGEGTAFTITLPMARVAPSPRRAEPAADQAPGGAETILLVEDEDMVRRLAHRVLAGSGYQVLEATSGDDALAQFGQGQPAIDLLVTDMVMPGIDGRTLAERLQPTQPAMKVLFMSGYTADSASSGEAAAAFLAKPFDARSLSRAVRSVLDSAASQEPGPA